MHVWFNLHKRVWSTRTGKAPVKHASAVHLVGCTFVVSETGRQRVLATRCRAVHAYAKGTPADLHPAPAGVWVSYNPYRGGAFCRKDTGAAVYSADELHFLPDGRMLAVNPQEDAPCHA